MNLTFNHTINNLDMKYLKDLPIPILFGCLMFCIGAGLLESCSKNDGQTGPSQGHLLKAIPDPPFWITIGGKPYRETESRPRDGKACTCKTCLGVCDVYIKPGGPTFILVPDDTNSGIGQGRIYLIDTNTTYNDPEFGIDAAIEVDGSWGSDSTLFDHVDLLPCEPSFYLQNDTLNFGGSTYYSIGYADIDIDKVK